MYMKAINIAIQKPIIVIVMTEIIETNIAIHFSNKKLQII